MRQSTYLTLAAALLFPLVAIVILKDSPPPDTEQRVATAAFQGPAMVEVIAFKRMEDGSLQRYISPAKTGDVVAFKVSSNRPIYLTLAASVNDQAPITIFDGARMPPGKERLLEKANFLLKFTIRPHHDSLKFCAVHDHDIEALQRRIGTLAKTWSSLPPSSCVEFKMNT